MSYIFNPVSIILCLCMCVCARACVGTQVCSCWMTCVYVHKRAAVGAQECKQKPEWGISVISPSTFSLQARGSHGAWSSEFPSSSGWSGSTSEPRTPPTELLCNRFLHSPLRACRGVSDSNSSLVFVQQALILVLRTLLPTNLCPCSY